MLGWLCNLSAGYASPCFLVSSALWDYLLWREWQARLFPENKTQPRPREGSCSSSEAEPQVQLFRRLWLGDIWVQSCVFRGCQIQLDWCRWMGEEVAVAAQGDSSQRVRDFGHRRSFPEPCCGGFCTLLPCCVCFVTLCLLSFWLLSLFGHNIGHKIFLEQARKKTVQVDCIWSTNMWKGWQPQP